MEIVIRAAVMFAFLWLVTRAVGKRELGQLSALELVLLVSMGDLVQQSITQEDHSLSGGVMTIGTFALLSVLLSWLSWRFPRSRTVLEGRPGGRRPRRRAPGAGPRRRAADPHRAAGRGPQARDP